MPDEDDEYEEDDPTDPKHPDWDLSVAAPAYLDREQKPWFLSRWFVGLVSILLIAGMLLPLFLRL